MPANSVAENVLGTIGTVCWTCQVLPQIWKSWREKSTEGLSHWLMLIWGVASAFMGVFALVRNLNIPLIVQPQLFGLLSIVSWSQCLYYGLKKPLVRTIVISVATLLILSGFEAGMVFVVRPASDRGNERPVQFFGIMTSILLAMGLLPQYWEIFRLGEVRGISITFIVIDTLGGVFSLLSLVFKPKFDILAGVAYSLVVVLDSAVVILAIILNPRAKRQRRRLTEADAEHRFQSGSTSSLDDTGAGHRELTTIDSRVSSTRSSHRNDVLNPVHLETDKEETLGEVQDEKLNEQ